MKQARPPRVLVSLPRGHSQAPGRQEELSSRVPGQGTEGLLRLGGINYEKTADVLLKFRE